MATLGALTFLILIQSTLSSTIVFVHKPIIDTTTHIPFQSQLDVPIPIPIITPQTPIQPASNTQSYDPVFTPIQLPPIEPCILPACVNPCGEFEYFLGSQQPYCSGYPNTRCQGYAECDRGCYARYFDANTNNEILNCQLIYPSPIIIPQFTPSPTTPLPTTKSPTIPITPSPTTPAPTNRITPAPTPKITPAPITPTPSPQTPTAPAPGVPAVTPAPTMRTPVVLPITPIPTVQQTANICPAVAEPCTDAVATRDRCCDEAGRNTLAIQCKYNGMDLNGNRIGTCCIRNNDPGCRIDTDCCNHPRRVCSTNGICVRANRLNAAIAGEKYDENTIEILGPYGKNGEKLVESAGEDGNNGYMNIGLTTSTMIWVSFVLLWLTICSVLYWFRKRMDGPYIDRIVDDTITSDTFDDVLEITSPHPMNV